MIKERLQTCFVKVTGENKAESIEELIRKRQQMLGGGVTGTAPHWMIQPNKRGTGDNQWVPPAKINC